MAFSESLTVRILGDSSELQRELDSVLDRFDELKSKISETSNSARQFSSSFSRLSQAIGPLQQVSNLISRIGQQLQAISQRPITLNVSPAIQALNRLTQAAQQAAAAIRAIPPVPAIGPALGPMPLPGGGGIPNQPIRQMASGGLVSGPSGIDQVPARLTSGEFVIRQSAAEVLGLGLLEQLNGNPGNMVQSLSREGSGRTRTPYGLSHPSHAAPASLQINTTRLRSALAMSGNQFSARDKQRLPSPQMSSQTVNHFGGITIQVAEHAESEALLRNLQLQGIGRRIRQG